MFALSLISRITPETRITNETPYLREEGPDLLVLQDVPDGPDLLLPALIPNSDLVVVGIHAQPRAKDLKKNSTRTNNASSHLKWVLADDQE